MTSLPLIKPLTRRGFFQSFLWAQYTPGDINGFITLMKSYQARLIEVEWDFPTDGLGHLVLDKFPANMNNIANMITHYGKEITVNTVIDNLRRHANNQHIQASGSGSRSDPITLFTDANKKCWKGVHNTLANHTKANCWFLHPHLKDLHYQRKKQAEKTQAATVSSFHSSMHQSPQMFILGSGLSAHMISDAQLVYTLKLKELGSVQTSSSSDTLKIKGIGSIKLKNKYGKFL